MTQRDFSISPHTKLTGGGGGRPRRGALAPKKFNDPCKYFSDFIFKQDEEK
jgi:hypothetical protein